MSPLEANLYHITEIPERASREKRNYIFWGHSLQNAISSVPVLPDDKHKSDAELDVAEVAEHSGEVRQHGEGGEAARVPEAQILLAMMQHHLGKHHLSPSLLSLQSVQVSYTLFW